MITPIEIKFNLGGDITAALTRLGCSPRQGVDRHLWFAESRTSTQAPRRSLLSNNIVIRMRSGDDNDDLTVTLRPCERSQLVGTWATPFTTAGLRYRIEHDWCNRRRVLAASAIRQLPPGSLRANAIHGTDVTTMLTPAQRQFLVGCTPPGPAIDRLHTLGPVTSTTWPRLRLGDLDVDAERWRITGLDLLELSLPVLPRPGESPTELRDRAENRQHRLHTTIERLGLRITISDTKTYRMLDALTTQPSTP